MQTDIVTMFADAFGERDIPAEDLALARRLLTHTQAEHIVAGLLRDHLSAMQAGGRDPVTEAGEARRSKNPPPVAAKEVVVVAETPPTKRGTSASEPQGERGPAARAPAGRDARRGRGGVDRGENRRPEGASPRTRGGRMPHAEFATWEPTAETDDDQPIFTEPATPRRERAGRSSAEAPRPARREEPLPTVIARDAGGVPIEELGAPSDRPVPDEDADFAQIFVNAGRRDGAKAGDFHRLLETSGVPSSEVGRIRVRERNSFVSVKKETLERAVAALAGQVVGGRTLIAEPARPREVG